MYCLGFLFLFFNFQNEIAMKREIFFFYFSFHISLHNTSDRDVLI